MVGKCPKNPKTLKGSVTCKDGNNNTCYCSKAGCACDKFSEPDAWASHDAQRMWCEKYDPGAKYNKFCGAHYISKDIGPLQQAVLPATDPAKKNEYCSKQCGFLDWACEAAKTQASCGGASNDLATLSLFGIAILAAIVLLR